MGLALKQITRRFLVVFIFIGLSLGEIRLGGMLFVSVGRIILEIMWNRWGREAGIPFVGRCGGNWRGGGSR